jgi:2-oxoglutarate ferredoxin oxidoreductase subunit beta
VEIYQNCPIFNDGAFDAVKDADTKADAIIPLVHGEPIRFGKPDVDGRPSKGIVRSATGGVEVADIADVAESVLLVHDAHADDPATAFALSRLTDAGVLHQSPIGIFRQIDRPTYDDQARSQIFSASAGTSDRTERINYVIVLASDTWLVETNR